MTHTEEKERMKALREERKHYIERARGNIKAGNTLIEAIKDQLAAGPKTVPDLAAALGMDSAKVLCFVAALKKYGDLVEGSKEGDYFTYTLATAGKAPAP